MKQRLLFATLSALATFSFISTAFAAMSYPMGWYLEGNAGSTHMSKRSYSGASSSSTSGWGFNANIGYKFMPYLAAEFGYTGYADTKINALGTRAGTDSRYALDLAAKGILPIVDSGFELFAKLGVSRLNSKITIDNSMAASSIGLSADSHNTTDVYLGAGGQYYIMPELAAVAQWQRANGNSKTGTLDLYSIGLSFIFE